MDEITNLIENVKLLRLKPKDIIIIKCGKELTGTMYRNINMAMGDLLEKDYPDVKFLILDKGVDMEVMRKDNLLEQLSMLNAEVIHNV